MSQALAHDPVPRTALPPVAWGLALAVTGWGLAAAAAAYTGLFERLAGPPFGGFVIGTLVAAMLAYVWLPGAREYLRAVSPRPLVGFHVWRIAPGVAFLYYQANGWLPPEFAAKAGWGDIVVGLLAVPVLVTPGGRAKYLAFHAVGFADLALAVGTAMALTFQGNPLMANVTTWPIVLVPAFGVGVTAALHLIAVDSLLRPRPAR